MHIYNLVCLVSFPVVTERSLFLIFEIFFCFLGPHVQHIEAPRLGVESELYPLAYAAVTAMLDSS